MTGEAVAYHPAPARGRTVIDNRVRQQLVERAALSVDGVVSQRTIVPGRTLPVVNITDGRDGLGIDIQVAATWPVDSASVLESVRAAVLRELSASLGEQAARVDVTITRIESARTPAQVADAYVGESSAEPAGIRPRRFAPRRAAAATYSGVLIAIALVVLGAVAVRDALTPADPWIATALRWATDLQWQWWVWPVAVVAAVLGLLLLVASVKPRRKTHVSVGDHIWVPRDAARRWTVTDDLSTDDREEAS